MNQVLALFSEEITESGLKDLQEKYPVDLVVDMSEESEVKGARKVRTERNKLVEAINRRRIDLTTELKTEGDALIEKVNDIYSVVVEPFEIELARQAEEKARKARELEEKLNKERAKMEVIKHFPNGSIGKSSEYIADSIEALNEIDATDFHKDVVHEAINAKKESLEKLTQMLVDTKAREALEGEREALRIQERINKLEMIPTTLFGVKSNVIQTKLDALTDFKVLAVEFGDRVEEVEQLKVKVQNQLAIMLSQTKVMESQQKPVEDPVTEQLTAQPPVEHKVPTAKEKLDVLMYGLTKHAARNSFIEFLEEWGLSETDYMEVKALLNGAFGKVKTYC